MGKRLVQNGIVPDQLISSPALRALSTAQAMAKKMAYPESKIVVEKRLYGADRNDWMKVIHSLNDNLQTIILFGHNPSLTEVANYLSPYSIYNVPTCGVLYLSYESETWKQVGEIKPSQVDFDYPKKAPS